MKKRLALTKLDNFTILQTVDRTGNVVDFPKDTCAQTAVVDASLDAALFSF